MPTSGCTVSTLDTTHVRLWTRVLLPHGTALPGMRLDFYNTKSASHIAFLILCCTIKSTVTYACEPRVIVYMQSFNIIVSFTQLAYLYVGFCKTLCKD